MTSKFEQLIEYVINDEEAKAKELFHDIVVEKSREIYENLMNEEESEEELEEAEESAEEELEEDEEEGEESLEEGMPVQDASEDLMREVETDEEGMREESDAEFDDEAEEAGEEETKDIEGGNDIEHDIEDRVVDLEDKLDELMAEFEALMGDEAAEHGEMEPVDAEIGGDAYAQDDTADFTDEMPMTENVDLVKVPAPQHGDNGANPKSPTAFNSGAAGMQGKPVKNTTTETNPDGTAAYKAPTSYADKGRGDLPGAGNFKNVPGKDGSKLAPAPKPKHGDNGANSRSPLPRG
jgi:hypothetical protein